MTYQEAKLKLIENEYLIGKKYLNNIIDDIIIFPSPIDYRNLSDALTLMKDEIPYSPNEYAPEYVLLAIFDLQNWSDDKPVPIQDLSALLKRRDSLNFGRKS